MTHTAKALKALDDEEHFSLALAWLDQFASSEWAHLSHIRYAREKLIAQSARIAALEAEVERLTKERDEALSYAHEATKAITGLTMGGSEFFGRRIGDVYTADLAACVAHIREKQTREHNRWAEAASGKKAAEAASAEVMARYEKHVDYSIDLSRIIESLCHGDPIVEPKTTARFHYEMAVAFQAALAKSREEGERLRDALCEVREVFWADAAPNIREAMFMAAHRALSPDAGNATGGEHG